MKSIKKICLIFFLTILLLIGTSFAETGKVNVSATRLRKENNTSSEILTNIYENDTVEILGEVEDWYQIKYDGKTGYVKKEYITVDKKTENTNTTNTTNTANVLSTNTANTTQNSNTVENTSNQVNSSVASNLDGIVLTFNSVANLKITPSLISTSISQFDQSKQVKKLSEMGNWLQVTDGTLTGWVLKSKTMDLNANQVNTSDFTNTTNENTVTNTLAQNTTNEVTNSTNTTNTTKNTNTVSNENKTTSSSAGKTGKINVETANVRKEASKNSSIIEFLDYNDVVNIVSEEGDWYKITAKNNISGYVSKTLVTLSADNTVTSRSLSEERNSAKDDTVVNKEINDSLTNALATSNSGNEVAEYAKQFLGYSYMVGGKTPSSGFDCSGFTRYIYSNFGYSLGSTASSQDSVGTEVSRDDLQVGDLILFYNEGKTAIGHTGIYIGNSEFIHSANPTRGVVTDNLNTNSYYNERFVSARRIVE